MSNVLVAMECMMLMMTSQALTLFDLTALIEDPGVEKFDISTIRDFYDQYEKSYDTPLCWDCALFRVLGYTEKYDDKRNG